MGSMCLRAVVALAVVAVAAPGRAALDGDQRGCEISGLQDRGVVSLVASEEQPQRLFASSWRTLSVSDDGGRSWGALTDRLPGPVIAAFGPRSRTLVAAGVRGVYVSRDGGRTWAPGVCGSSFYLFGTAVGDADGRTIYLAGQEDIVTGQGGGLYRTRNGGRSWTRLAGLPDRNRNVNVVAIDPTDARRLYVATEAGGILTSSDGGRHFVWRTVGTRGAPLSHGEQVTAISLSPVRPFTLWVGTRGGGVFRSTNAGLRWSRVGLAQRWIDDIAADPALPNRAYVAEGGIVGPVRTHAPTATLTTRDGHTWHVITQLPGEWQLLATRSGTVYAWRGRTIRKTTDHGATWTPTGPIPD